jgi:hypothetical protein
MQMPKAAMNENHFRLRSENHIWATRQILPVQPVSVPHPVNQPANQKFWLCILRPNQAHSDATLGWAKRVHRYCGFGLRCLRARAFLRITLSAVSDSFDTLNTFRTALSNRSQGVFPGTSGAGEGFILPPQIPEWM